MTNQHDHAHAPDDASHATTDDHGSPGRATRTAQLVGPVARRPSGLVARKAEAGARDDHGVAANAEHAVADASSSAGSPLPATVMRSFESSLGADLSSVRVHTGAASATAARAVGAKAYTIGQDIHFGAGRYDPSSASGRHLLAHEVAHTAQQRSGPPSRQHKLEVSAPHDPAEHDADRAADAMVTGAPARVSNASTVARQPIHRKDADAAADPPPNPNAWQFCDGDDFTHLKIDLSSATKVLAAFASAQAGLWIAAINGISLDNPQAAVAMLHPPAPAAAAPTTAAPTTAAPSATAPTAAPALPSAVSQNNAIEREAVDMASLLAQQALSNVHTAAIRLSDALYTRATLPSQQAVPTPDATSGAGTTVSTLLDTAMQAIGLGLNLSGAFGTQLANIATAIGGSDAAKGLIQGALDSGPNLAAVAAQVATSLASINQIISAHGAELGRDACAANDELQSDLSFYNQFVDHYLVVRTQYLKDLTAAIEASATAPAPTPAAPASAAAPAAPPGTPTTPTTSATPPTDSSAHNVALTYQAIVDANLAYQAAKSAMVGQLAPGAYQRWVAVLVPAGTPTMDATDSGAPGSIAGTMFIYQKNGVSYVFRDTEATVMTMSGQMALVANVYGSGPQIEQRAAAWADAMQAATGVH